MANEQSFQIAIAEEVPFFSNDESFTIPVSQAKLMTPTGPLADIRRITEWWRDGYDQHPQERELNILPMFMRRVEVGIW